MVCGRRLGARFQAWTGAGRIRDGAVAGPGGAGAEIFAGKQSENAESHGILRGGHEEDTPVETSGRGVRLVEKEWFFVCAADSPL